MNDKLIHKQLDSQALYLSEQMIGWKMADDSYCLHTRLAIKDATLGTT